MPAVWSIIRGEPDAVIRWARPLMITGVVLVFASVRLHFPGVIVGTFAITLGACGRSFVDWRREQGLWMLAGLFFLMFLAAYGLVIFGQLRDVVRGAPQPGILLMVEVSLGTILLSTVLRFLWRVGRFNWQLSKEPSEH